MKILVLLLLTSSLAFTQVKFKTATTDGPRPWNNLQFNDSSDQFQFAIVSDRTGGHRPGVFMDGVKKLNLLQPEFVMTVGDLIEGYTTDKRQINKEWDEFDGFVNSLDMPFFYLPGNHDYINPVMAQIWKERYGPDHYYFVYNNVLFLCLNSEEQNLGSGKGSISDQQYEWTKEVLAKHPEVRWTMVFMHQPLWDQEADVGKWFEVEELLKEKKHTVFVGHRHSYVAYERNKSNYYILATTGGGGRLRGPQLGEFDHFAWVTMTDEGPIMANLALNGIYDDQLMTSEVKAITSKAVSSNMVQVSQWSKGVDSVQIKLSNPFDFEINADMSTAFNWDIKTDIPKAQISLGPNSTEIVYLHLEPRKGKTVTNESEVILKTVLHFPEEATHPNFHIPFKKVLKPSLK